MRCTRGGCALNITRRNASRRNATRHDATQRFTTQGNALCSSAFHMTSLADILINKILNCDGNYNLKLIINCAQMFAVINTTQNHHYSFKHNVNTFQKITLFSISHFRTLGQGSRIRRLPSGIPNPQTKESDKVGHTLVFLVKFLFLHLNSLQSLTLYIN